jgi:hypothetical protein
MRPRTPASGSSAWAWDVIGPPNERPPANRGRLPALRPASANAARPVTCAVAGLSGRRLPFSMYGNWCLSVAAPKPSNPAAIAAMKR